MTITINSLLLGAADGGATAAAGAARPLTRGRSPLQETPTGLPRWAGRHCARGYSWCSSWWGAPRRRRSCSTPHGSHIINELTNELILSLSLSIHIYIYICT